MVQINGMTIDPRVRISHPDKPLWSELPVTKAHYTSYLANMAPFMLPFLAHRALTVVRYPHGVPGDSFFQKNCPDYAPDFIRTAEIDGTVYIVCNDLSTLLWLGNQSALEFHVPFNRTDATRPLEIVFDLDPPDRSAFPLAVKAAREMKAIFDRLGLVSYPKLSGSRGLQIHIPISGSGLTYRDTRQFTSFIARLLVQKFPDSFTVERLKKNRGRKLYVDYVQHAEGKTLICPYSTRGKPKATVAAPLYWEEVTDSLKIDTYNLPFVLKRTLAGTCPMADYFEQKNEALPAILSTIKKTKNSKGRQTFD